MPRWTVIAALLLPMVAQAGFRVSSFKEESRRGNVPHNAASAIDGDTSTAWMVDPAQPNQGSWFEIDLPKATVDKVSMVVGWAQSDDTFSDYPRAKTVKVEVFDEAKDGEKVLEHSISLEDTQERQVIDIPDAEVGSDIFGGRVRLTIQEVYPGKDYPNVAVSEVLIHLGEFDAPVALQQPPGDAAEGHPAEHLVDDSARTFWASTADGAGQSFEVGADGYGVSRIGITPGPSSHARPKTIEVVANDVTKTYEVADEATMQWFEVPAIVGYTGSGWGDVEIKIVDTHDSDNPAVAIADVKLKATTYGGL